MASANRRRAAGADQLGFGVVGGSAADLDAVELLMTSLLVQADGCDVVPRSPRQRERDDADEVLLPVLPRPLRPPHRGLTKRPEAARAAGADLLPVLRSHEAKFAEEFLRLVPHSVGRSVTVTNSEGWRPVSLRPIWPSSGSTDA